MDIKKADSKGRVSGFESDRYYEVVLIENGGFLLAPIIQRDELLGGDYLNRLNRLGKYAE